MRLFIAINFSEELKDLIYEKELLLENKMINGHIQSKNNLHLTLVFIGETNKPKEISDILNNMNEKQFDIFVKGIKYFNQRGKRLYYLDIEKNNNLIKIYNYLFNELSLKGFDIEEREYKPHITLAREVELSENVNIENLNYTYKIKRISLMESKKINNELKYIEIYGRNLI